MDTCHSDRSKSNPVLQGPLQLPGPVRTCQVQSLMPLACGTHKPTSTPCTQQAASSFSHFTGEDVEVQRAGQGRVAELRAVQGQGQASVA